MTNLSNFLGGSIYSGSRNYLLPRTSISTSVSSPLSWNSNEIDMIIITGQTVNFTINADSGSPIDGQRFLLRVKTSGTRTITFTGGSSKSFRPVGTSLVVSGSNFNYSLSDARNTYFGCIYNNGDNRWDIISIGEQTI
jgi:hypothetical protein